jgi:formylglycine-generating enzyme required for sulfatase activity
MMSMRADFFGDLMKDEALYAVHRLIKVPALHEAQVHKVVSRPAELLSARFETKGLVDIITRRTAEDAAKDVGALPLLSYTLDDMWRHMIERGDGVLRLPAQSFELANVLVARADTFLANRPKSEDELRRIFTLKLATVREGEEPTRRRAFRSEFTDEEWRLVTELADHPNRLLVTATPENGEAYAEVAQEAIFRRWRKLHDWIAAEREFLAWKTVLESARSAWQGTSDSSKDGALMTGVALAQAQIWLGKRSGDLPVVDRNFIDQSTKRESKVRSQARRMRALVYLLLLGIITGLVGWIKQGYVKEQLNWYWTMRPYKVTNVDPHVLTPEAEHALKPGDSFRECAKDCPEMVVVPTGDFMMGSPTTEEGRYPDENPPHKVMIAERFAVSKYDVTCADWGACVSVGGCPQISDNYFAGGRKLPVINVSWDEAQQYVAWFSKVTGRPYRLLSEAEWEYAARAGRPTVHYWGDEIGKNNANCSGCGSEWDNVQTSPVGSFKPNAFGLYDMAGNVWQWVQDCYYKNYNDAPADSKARSIDNCRYRVARGGGWYTVIRDVRSAERYHATSDGRRDDFGFRLGRTITP